MRQIVTEWFRTPRVWPILARLLAATGRPVTVWSGGCGTGEEPYSAAILLADHGIPGRIVATDLDADLVAIAQRATYHARDIDTNVHEGRLTRAQVARYFIADRQGGYTVRREIRARVAFGTGTLGVDAPPSCDVALCRNVWRHIDRGAQGRLARHIQAALPDTGRLVLGGGDLTATRPGADLTQLTPADLVDYWPTGLRRRFAEADHELVWRKL